METHVLLDVREDSLKGIGGVGNVQFWMAKVDEKVWKISLHAVVGAPQSTMGVVPSSCELIDGSLLQKHSPLVMPEFQPQRELCFVDVREISHERLQVLCCFELRPPRHVARDNGCLVEMAHLHRHGKALQYATSAIADDRFDLPSDRFQFLNAILVGCDGFVGKEFPQEILFAVGTPPHHDAELALEVRRVHDNDHLIGCQFSLLINLDAIQLSLHPLRTASVLLCNLRMGLFAMRKLTPDIRLS